MDVLNVHLRVHYTRWAGALSARFWNACETLLYVKFQPSLELSWPETNPAGAKFSEMVVAHMNFNKYGYDVW